MAAALTVYDDNTEVIEEAKYGELVIEHYGWGYGDGLGAKSTDLNYHWCTDEELGIIQGPNTIIYPHIENSVNEIKTYRKKFKCIDNKNLKIWGVYNSAKAQQIAVKFRMCDDRPDCESKEAIRDWLKGKYILLLYN